MKCWLAGILVVLFLAAPTPAQEAAKLGKLPAVHVLTALKSGEWDDLEDLIAEGLDESQDYAEERDIKLTRTEVVIYELSGLKTFRARIGFVIDPGVKSLRPGRYGKNIDLRLLKGSAYVATGTGGAAAAIPVRRKVLDELEKPGVRRLKGIETIELFHGDMGSKETAVEVYGPLR